MKYNALNHISIVLKVLYYNLLVIDINNEKTSPWWNGKRTPIMRQRKVACKCENVR